MAQVDPVEEIERLFELAGTERAVLDRLDGCVADLHAAHQAKSALQRLQRRAATRGADPAQPAHLREAAMTAATTSAPSLVELRRAWAAVQSGAFTEHPRPPRISPPTDSGGGWRPAPGERVVPVVKCPGTIGATTMAVALATAAVDARVLECSSFTGSGLSAASTAELGADPAGWIRGTRGPVGLQRCAEVVCSVAEVPAPTAADRAVLTVVDVGWDVGSVMSSPGWLRDQLIEADTVVVVTAATSPGLRHLDTLAAMVPGDRLVRRRDRSAAPEVAGRGTAGPRWRRPGPVQPRPAGRRAS